MDKALVGSLGEVVREDRPPGPSFVDSRSGAKTAETRKFGAMAAFWLCNEVIGAD